MRAEAEEIAVRQDGSCAPCVPPCLASWAPFGPLLVDAKRHLDSKWTPHALGLPPKCSPSALQSPPNLEKPMFSFRFFKGWPSCGPLGAPLGPPWRLLGAARGPLGSLLSLFGTHLGPFWDQKMTSWSQKSIPIGATGKKSTSEGFTLQFSK